MKIINKDKLKSNFNYKAEFEVLKKYFIIFIQIRPP